MKRTWPGALALALVCALSMTGCGTVCNLASKDPQIYGGVQFDFDVVSSPGHHGSGSGSSAGNGAVFLVALVLADACLSVVADTLTFPLVCFLEGKNDAHSHDAPAPAPSPAAPAAEPEPAR